MSLYELLIIAVGLSADAFAVSVTNGISIKKRRIFNAFLCGGVFGIFQGIMPAIGYGLGMIFEKYIVAADHYIALILLGFIGIKMLKDAGKQDKHKEEKLGLTLLIIQGFATSVDAMTVGISFAALGGNIVMSAAVICIVTFFACFSGFIFGVKAGKHLGSKAQIFGGGVLIILGLKIFFEHIFC